MSSLLSNEMFKGRRHKTLAMCIFSTVRPYLFAVLLVGSPGTLKGEDLGIDFAKMPVGLQAHYQGTPHKWVDIFKGKMNGRYVLERRYGSAYGDVMVTKFYNDHGLEVERQYPSGRVVNYEPFHCGRSYGECTHRVRLANGKSGEGSGHVVWSGDKLYFHWQLDGASNVVRRHFKLGKYGLLTFLRENDTLMVLDVLEGDH